MERFSNERDKETRGKRKGRMGKGTRTRLYKLVLLIMLVALYKALVYLFSSAVWLLCARIVLLGIIFALLLNLLFPSK